MLLNFAKLAIISKISSESVKNQGTGNCEWLEGMHGVKK